MKLGDVYDTESTTLKAADLQGKARRLKISGYEIREFTGNDGRTQNKVCLAFEGAQKQLVLNKTNAMTIESNLGADDLDQWKGKEITIFPTKTSFSGERVDCIRVKEEIPETAADFDDDIPF